MGGCCCCCSSKEPPLNPAPGFYYYPREERLPLSSHHGAPAAAISTGLLVDTNLNMSVPTAYRPPPSPVPFDVPIARPQTPQEGREAGGDRIDGVAQTTNSGTNHQISAVDTREISAKCDMKDSECNLELDPKEVEVEISKSVEDLVLSSEEEDVCPICLEEYDAENPKLTTKCEHHFHLACILEWMERSDTCPVCDKEMIIDDN